MPRPPQPSLATLALATLLCLPAAAQSVRVVDDDGGPGVDHTSLQDAVDAAAEGEILLVKGGTYGPLLLGDKSLVITAELGESVVVGQTLLSNLSAPKRVTLTGLTIHANFGGTGLVLSNSPGQVLVTECTVVGQGIPLFQINTAVTVTGCASVTFSECVVSVDGASGGYPGLDAVLSDVHLYDCSVAAGNQGVEGLFGPPGAEVNGGFLFASGTTFRGGNGGVGVDDLFFCNPGGDGGLGLQVLSGAELRTVDCQFLGGLGGGPSPSGNCGPGAPGQGLDTTGAGSVDDYGVTAHHFSVESPLREGASSVIEFNGEPNESVWFYWSLGMSQAHSGVIKGTIVPGPAPFTIFFGSVGPTGTLSLPITIPVEPALLSVALYEQAIFFDPLTRFVMTNPELSVVLDQSL